MEKRDLFEDFCRFIKNNMPETVYLVKNHPRYEEVTENVRALHDFFREEDEEAEITVCPDELVGTMLAIEIKTVVVSTPRVKELAALLAKADSLDVYSTTDGRTALIVGFEGAYKPYEGRQEEVSA